MRIIINAFYLCTITCLFFIAGVVVCSCDRKEQQRCRMTNEFVVAKSRAAARSLTVLRLDAARVAVFWSADGGAYYALVNNQGIPISEPAKVQWAPWQKVVPKTYWSHHEQPVLDAVSMSPVLLSKNDVALAMLCHQGDSAATIVVARLDVTAQKVRWLKSVGESGLFAKTVSATLMGESVVIGFQDTRTSPQSVALVAVNANNGQRVKTAEISSGQATYGPAMAQNGDAAVILWSEVGKDGKTVQLRSAALTNQLSLKSPHRIDSLELFDAAADVVPFNDGFAAVFRDNRDGDRTEEFYFTQLDRNGKRIAPVKRISRADGPEGPRLSSGNSFFFSSAVRSYNNNYLVGFNRFDRTGAKTGGEFQVYADKCDFIRSDVVTWGDTAILVYGENADNGGRILASTISCN